MSSTNLSPQAIRDLRQHIRRSSREFGPSAAQKLANILMAKCDEVAEGLNLGHRRFDIDDSLPYRFLSVPPLVIAYNPVTRRIVRILDGRRDFPSVFRQD